MTRDRGSRPLTAEFGDRAVSPSAPHLSADFSRLVDAVETTDAAAFVHVGDRFDDDMRYLTQFDGPDRASALVVTPDCAVLCAPRLCVEQATREFVSGKSPTGESSHPEDSTLTREVSANSAKSPPGKRAAEQLATLGTDEGATVLTPREIPHTAVVYLEREGYIVSSTTAVEHARAVKSSPEIDRLCQIQRATTRGMARAETILASADPGEKALQWNDEQLTTESLQREINAELAAAGLQDAGNSVIGSGQTAATRHFTGTAPICSGETVVIDLSPRDSTGYHGSLARTFVVDSNGGWERRAYVAVEAARKAALATVEAGCPASTVHQEAAAEITAHGFADTVGDSEPGDRYRTGHGVGISLHERPALPSDTELETGHVLTIAPTVCDPDYGAVRLKDVVVVRETGFESLATYPFDSSPTVR